MDFSGIDFPHNMKIQMANIYIYIYKIIYTYHPHVLLHSLDLAPAGTAGAETPAVQGLQQKQSNRKMSANDMILDFALSYLQDVLPR